VEEVPKARGSQPRTRIPHRDEHAARPGPTGADQQFSRPLADAAHRLDGVDDQVKNDLLQLNSVSLNERQALRELRLHRDAILHRFATGQSNHLKDRFVDVQAILPWRRLLDKGPHSVDYVAGSIA